MVKRELVPPLQERRPPTLVQKRPGRWVCRFRWRGQVMERAVSLSVKPTPKDEGPPSKIEQYAWRTFTQPYVAGTWSPYEDAIYGPATGPERGPTVAEAKERFLKRYDVGSKTYESYEFVLRRFEETLDPHALCTEVEADHVRSYVYRRGVTRATQRHSWRHLRAYFNWCVKERILEENPIERVDAPRVEDKQMPFIPPERMSAILKACDASLPPFLSLAYRVALGAGIRRDELRHLQAQDVNLDYNYLIVRNKEVDGKEVRTKGRADRRVPLNALSRTALEEALNRCPKPTDLLFSERGRVTTKDRHSKALARLLEVEDVHLPRALHSLRGHYITYLLLLEWPVPLVQALVDHKDPNVTYGYLREVQSLLFGETRSRFRQAAIELGFDPYQALPATSHPSTEVG